MPERRQDEAIGLPLEQCPTRLLLETLQLKAQRGLAEVQLACSITQASTTGDSLETVQQADVDRHYVYLWAGPRTFNVENGNLRLEANDNSRVMRILPKVACVVSAVAPSQSAIASTPPATDEYAPAVRAPSIAPPRPTNARPLPVIRFWSGTKSNELTDEQFLRGLEKVLIPDTTKVGAGAGLIGYTPVVVSSGGTGLPDEIALVAYYDQGYYDAIRATPEGARYGRNHARFENVANIPGAEDLEGKALFTARDDAEHPSSSRTPLVYTGEIKIGEAYTTRPNASFDWMSGNALVRVYQRNANVSDAEYTDAIRRHIASSTNLSGHFLRVEQHYVLEYAFTKGGSPLKRLPPAIAKLHQETPLAALPDERAQSHSFGIARGAGFRLTFPIDYDALSRGPTAVTRTPQNVPVLFPAGIERLEVSTRDTTPSITLTAKTDANRALAHGTPRINGSTITIAIHTTRGDGAQPTTIALPELSDKPGPWTVLLTNAAGEVFAKLPLSPTRLVLTPHTFASAITPAIVASALPKNYRLEYLSKFVDTPIEVAPDAQRGEHRLQKLGGTMYIGRDPSTGHYAIRKLATFKSWDAQGREKIFDTDREIRFSETPTIDDSARLRIESYAAAAENTDGRATILDIDRTTGRGTLSITLWRNPAREGTPYFDQVYPFEARHSAAK